MAKNEQEFLSEEEEEDDDDESLEENGNHAGRRRRGKVSKRIGHILARKNIPCMKYG